MEFFARISSEILPRRFLQSIVQMEVCCTGFFKNVYLDFFQNVVLMEFFAWVSLNVYLDIFYRIFSKGFFALVSL